MNSKVEYTIKTLKKLPDMLIYLAGAAVPVGLLIMIWFSIKLGLQIFLTGLLVVVTAILIIYLQNKIEKLESEDKKNGKGL